MLLPFVLGTVLGSLAGYFGGWVDTTIMRLVDIVVAFPFYVLIIALVFVLGPGERSIYIAITAVGWVAYARIIRGEILVAKRQDYVTAARSGGLSNLRIMRRHLLPNVITQAFIYAMSDIVQDILAIVTLGYFGLGIPPPTADLGIDDQRRAELPVHPLAADHHPGPGRGGGRAGAFAGRRRPGRPAEAGPVSGEPILEVRDLHVRIASRRGIVRAVDGVSFDVPRGGALGLVGESGSGKSMTLRAILGVLPAEAQVTSGEIRLDGVDLRQLRGSDVNRLRGSKMAMIFQEPMSALNPVMRVGRQIAEGPQVHLGLSRGRATERALELMRRVGIPDPERRFRAYPHEFSGGMRQRVMIAIALSCDPEIILCDEPTTAWM